MKSVVSRWLLAALLIGMAAMVSAAPVAPSSEGKGIDDAVSKYREKVETRLEPRFRFANVSWPPEEVTLLAIKESKQVELWALDKGKWHHVRDYEIKGISGELGPKLKQGDEQVPEGFYRISRLNPNSAFHLSMKLNYPNIYDRIQAQREGRTNLGGDIYIHGAAVSRGCLAVGDNAIEELFVLTAMVGMDKVSVMIAPKDFREKPEIKELNPNAPAWVTELHGGLAENMKAFTRFHN